MTSYGRDEPHSSERSGWVQTASLPVREIADEIIAEGRREVEEWKRKNVRYSRRVVSRVPVC